MRGQKGLRVHASTYLLPDSIEVEGDVILVRRVLIHGVTDYAIISNDFT